MSVASGVERLTLRDLLTESRERVAVEPEHEYPVAGVYGFGRGILLRDVVKGREVSAKHLYRIHAGQIIYSRLKAFEGAFALVPEKADGRYVSNEFPTFDVRTEIALPEFVAVVLRMPETWARLTERITGMGARRERLQVDEFLTYEVDVPPLKEQRRLVQQVSTADAVASAAATEARAARAVAEAIYARLEGGEGWQRVRLGDVIRIDIAKVAVVPEDEYRIAGVVIAGGGLFRRATITGAETNYERLHRLRANQLVYRKLTAWEGPITVVPDAFDGFYVSPEFPTFTLDESQVLPEFMRFVCERSAFHVEMKARSKGTAERRGRLNPEDLLEIDIDLPALQDQRRVAAATSAAFAATHEAERARAIAANLPARLLGQRDVELASR